MLLVLLLIVLLSGINLTCNWLHDLDLINNWYLNQPHFLYYDFYRLFYDFLHLNNRLNGHFYDFLYLNNCLNWHFYQLGLFNQHFFDYLNLKGQLNQSLFWGHLNINYFVDLNDIFNWHLDILDDLFFDYNLLHFDLVLLWDLLDYEYRHLDNFSLIAGVFVALALLASQALLLVVGWELFELIQRLWID